MNRIGKVLLETVMALVSCYSTIQALTQERWTCFAMMVISAILLGLALYWIKNRNNYERSALFIISAGVMFFFSFVQLQKISREEERSRIWKSYVQSNFIYTEGRYIVKEEPTDGPSAMEVARNSFIINDFETAREYAIRAKNDGVLAAYEMLTGIYFQGLGVSRDYRQAFHLLLEGMKMAKMEDAEDAFEAILSSGYSPTIGERSVFDRRLKDNHFLAQVEKEIEHASEVSRKKIKSVLNSHHKRLVELSESGSIEAVFMLYMECVEEKWSNPQRGEAISGKTREYAERLAAADFLPTDPYSRAQFFSFLDGPQVYCASNVDYFIRRNFYPNLLSVMELENDLDDESEYLFAKYRLYKAQYEYMKSIVSGTRWNNTLLSYQFIFKPDAYFDFCKEELQSIIDDIKKVMPSLEQ